MDESVLLGTKPLVDSIRHSIRDLSGVFSVWHACECHIAHWRHDSRHFYFVEWTWFLVSFLFVVSKHRQAGLICLIKRRKRMSFPKNSRTRTWYRSLDDFKAFRENSSQGIAQSARFCKEENKSGWKLSAVKTLPRRIQVKVSNVFSSCVTLFSWQVFHVFCLIGIQLVSAISWTRVLCIFCEDEQWFIKLARFFENNEIKIGNFNYIWSPYNKKNITRWLKDMNFMFSWQKRHLTRSLRSLVRYCFCHSNIKFISSRHRVISSMYDYRPTWTPLSPITNF